ncbi:MAG TPA: SDR family oxidoreductase [Chthoniobacterales bacterium]|jgi:NAD(P)-dependent dehydrogenase (short-subunit alcohol dehydrogenase family)|nr:SDR family oxidoreductase [Chthoniobacterales bacterium]
MHTKTVLITGGTTGIGLATAQLLSAEGAKVIVTGRNPETLASAKKILGDVVVLPSDSADLAAAQGLGDEIRTFADHLDGAFLNAGIATFAPFEAATPKNFDDMFNVNVRGLYFQLQSLLPLLANPSSVVFTSSIAGSGAFATASIYSATKAAVISLGKILAVELAPRGVRVNVLSPGPIDTPILKKTGLPADQLKGFEEMIVGKSLLKRFGTSEEVARAARFLLSEDSSNITGTELIIDGGVRLS